MWVAYTPRGCPGSLHDQVIIPSKHANTHKRTLRLTRLNNDHFVRMMI